MDSSKINPINSFGAFSGSSLSSQDLDPLVKLISTRLGISEFTAFRVLRKFMGTANASTFQDIQSFITKFLDDPQNQRQVNELAKDLQTLQKNPNANEQSFKPIISRLQYGLQQNNQVQTQTPQNNAALSRQDRFVATNQSQANPATKLVQTPQLFASWLVNNKSAFITLKQNPEVANLLLALQNPRIAQSPVMMSQIAVLIGQLLKLKQGKGASEDKDEIRKEKLDRKHQAEFTDEAENRVNSINPVTAVENVKALTDFLLEAERFAEEEIANLWSLTLKKEKELEQKFKKGFESFKKKEDK
jgi:hypothetical protein